MSEGLTLQIYHEGKPNYKWICELWNSITFIWPHSICQVKLDFLGVDWSIIARDCIQVLKEENSSSCIHRPENVALILHHFVHFA